MTIDKSVLVCGIGETASATARRLHGEGYAVAIFRATAPRLLRRRMSYADVWFDGFATLDGVEARRADVACEFLLGLQTRSFIPLLRQQLRDVLGRWPFDAIVACREDEEPLPPSLIDLAEITIGLGPGFTPGGHCDLVIETEGLDPGAILRAGDAPSRSRDAEPHASRIVFAPSKGLFRAQSAIGATVEEGDLLGHIGETRVVAPIGGRIKGLARREQAVDDGAPVAEIAFACAARVTGVSDRNQMIARSVAFAIEMECEGWTPAPFESWS
ncbi:MAG TPA: hypothetical protein VK446_15810 [Methylocystis sp.]|nr:hypothetical protein [Methylocystis sp.]